MISDAIDDSKYAVGIFIDLKIKKPFDTSNQNILITHMDCYGVRSIQFKWLNCYKYNAICIL